MRVSNQEHAIARGEISEERKDRYEKAFQSHQKLLASAQSIADGLNLSIPDFPEDKTTEISVKFADIRGGMVKEISLFFSLCNNFPYQIFAC